MKLPEDQSDPNLERSANAEHPVQPRLLTAGEISAVAGGPPIVNM